MTRLSRRKVLVGAAGLLALGAGGRAALAAMTRDGLVVRTRAGTAFQTTIDLTVAGADTDQLEAALHAAFVAVRDVEDASSVYRRDGELARLNRDGRLASPSKHLLTLLRYGAELSRATDGRYDYTVQPLWDHWAAAHAEGWRPTPADLAPVLERIDWRGVTIADDHVVFDRPGMAVTLNSINQSYATDVVMAVLAARGIEHAFINTGEFGARGQHPEGRPWRLGIADPRDTDEIAFTIDPFRRFAATSGDYKTYFSPDFRDHHIFDPRTGYSPPDWSSITVEAPTGLVANGLTTALFASRPDEAQRLMAAHPECRARFFGKDGSDRGDLSMPA